ncbi:MAG: peptidyl-prolyl cis-trans isomerase [Gammaproteobacteria bacterium]|nr:peptidyl-prolyl cis-trans isomerase [Gammaproteobacteria bacterium]
MGHLVSRLLREPLLYFFIAGAALFLLNEGAGTDADRRIVVSEAERQRLSDQWQAQMGRTPTGSELDALVEQWIREEIYYREARAMGLDEDDIIIRRRLAQKLTFLTEDLATGRAPPQADLERYYQEHAERYTEPERYSFSHRYYSRDRRETAESDARADLAALSETDAEELPQSDPFMLQRRYAQRSQREIGELFGREFAAALSKVPTGRWQGPIRSAYGWHLVLLEQRLPARQLTFAEAAKQVATDYRQDQQRQANEALYQSLRERYEIVRQ